MISLVFDIVTCVIQHVLYYTCGFVVYVHI